MTDKDPVAVIGAGAWGTALAWSIASSGAPTKIWAREKEVAEAVNFSSENSLFLPGVTLPKNLTATNDMAEAVDGRRVVVFVAPSQFMRSTLASLAGSLSDGSVVVSATKGIENDTLALPVDIMADTLPRPIANRCCFLSGPTFAKELVRGVPTAATIASKDRSAALVAKDAISSRSFRLYISDDVMGVELGGALKNIIAIAAGISDGLGYGHNTRAAIITRGLAEIIRLGVNMGADARTFAGLSGIGDLVLTCAGDLSRNRMVGLRLGKGETLKEIVDSMHAVAEGVATAASVYSLAKERGVEMPIASAVYSVLHDGMDPRQAVTGLMSREAGDEF